MYHYHEKYHYLIFGRCGIFTYKKSYETFINA
jgi:hypothetical protein